MESFLKAIAVSVITFTVFLMTIMVGWVGYLIEADKSYISLGIIGLLFWFVNYPLHKIWQLSNSDGEPDFEEYGRNIKLMNYMTGLLPALGMIGTVIGFIMLLSGFGNLDMSNVDSAKTMMTTIGSGMGIALLTTLIGLIGSVIIGIQAMIFENALERKYQEYEGNMMSHFGMDPEVEEEG